MSPQHHNKAHTLCPRSRTHHRPGAFAVFCTQQGCVKEARASIKSINVSYTWVFVLISAIISLFLALTLWRLSHWSDCEEIEIELENVNKQRRAPPPEMGGPITPVGYLAVAKVSDQQAANLEKLNNTPSWLVGV